MKEQTSIIFTGDIGFDKHMQGRFNDTDLISPELLDYLHSADHTVANVEGPIVGVPENTITEGAKQLLHTMDPGAVKVLTKIGADIWNLCNNHIMDAGPEGVESTLAKAAEAGAVTIGAGMNIEKAAEPLIIPEAGGIGIFAVGYRRGCKPAGENLAGCLLWNDLERIKKNINDIKSRYRWCLIISHGGEEFTSLPSPYIRDRYLSFLEMGADAVICHHPHVPMNYEFVGNKPIFYSLGNFIFDTDYQRAQFNTESGVLLKLYFTEEKMDFEACGIKIDRETETVQKSALPRIFTDVPANEYELLSPLAAKMFLAATKRREIYLNPDEWKNASDGKWAESFANPMRSGRVEGEALDFRIIVPLAEKESEKAWEKSSLKDVIEYIKEQM